MTIDEQLLTMQKEQEIESLKIQMEKIKENIPAGFLEDLLNNPKVRVGDIQKIHCRSINYKFFFMEGRPPSSFFQWLMTGI